MAQSLAQVHLHLVFSTKNRVASFRDTRIRNELHAYLAAAFKAQGAPAHTIGGTSDHLHVLFGLPRDCEIASLVANVKRNSSIWIKTKGPAYGSFHWQNGYGVFSVSHSHVDKVAAYVRDQDTHHRRLSFQDEYRSLLRKHGVQFDERYVWD
ncbi:MAG: transposase [Candidatus Hydrogenedentes bacterium]|nr:transposase [Candidatus Hydrogenedentota bacterium]